MTATARHLPAVPPASAPHVSASSAGSVPSHSLVASAPNPLLRLRDEIDRLDHSLIGLIAERVRLGRRVGLAKREIGLPVLDPAREAAVVRRPSALAREAGVEDAGSRYIFWKLLELSRRAQVEDVAASALLPGRDAR